MNDIKHLESSFSFVSKSNSRKADRTTTMASSNDDQDVPDSSIMNMVSQNEDSRDADLNDDTGSTDTGSADRDANENNNSGNVENDGHQNVTVDVPNPSSNVDCE